MDRSTVKLYNGNMNMEHTKHTRFHRSWFRPRKNHGVDKQGVAVALAVLVAITVMAGGRGDKPEEKNRGQEQPAPSAVGYRSEASASREAGMLTSNRPAAAISQAPPDPKRNISTRMSH